MSGVKKAKRASRLKRVRGRQVKFGILFREYLLFRGIGERRSLRKLYSPGDATQSWRERELGVGKGKMARGHRLAVLSLAPGLWYWVDISPAA